MDRRIVTLRGMMRAARKRLASCALHFEAQIALPRTGCWGLSERPSSVGAFR